MLKFIKFMFRVFREVTWIAIAGATIYGGLQGYKYLADNREIVEPIPIERPQVFVETQTFDVFDGPLPIRGQGFVTPFAQINLASQAGGTITYLHPAISNLTKFEEGVVLARIDSSVEEASLRQNAASIAAALARLELVETQLERAKTLRERGISSQQALDTLLSQATELQANLANLEAAQDSIQISLANKEITAPFTGSVAQKFVEVGSVVGAGQALADIFTHERMEVTLPLSEAEAALIPGLFELAKDNQPVATPVAITLEFAGQPYVWAAHITRVAPTLDPRTRTLAVSATFDDVAGAKPLNNADIAAGNPPVLINAYAEVEISGATYSNIFAVPSTSVRNQETVWIGSPVSEGMRVSPLPVRVIHVAGSTSYVQALSEADGDRLVLTNLGNSAEGMIVQDVSADQVAEAVMGADQ